MAWRLDLLLASVTRLDQQVCLSVFCLKQLKSIYHAHSLDISWVSCSEFCLCIEQQQETKLVALRSKEGQETLSVLVCGRRRAGNRRRR